MVSSVSSGAAFSSAMLSGSQCRGSRDTQALQEKLFTRLDVNGDGGIDETELGDFMNFAASSGGTESTDSSGLFATLDADGDGAISQTEMSDGAKALFDQLRTQLMTAATQSNETSDQETTDSSVEADRPPPPPEGARPHGHGGHGMFAKIESLLDQYRSNSGTDAATEQEATATLSVAA